MNSVKGLKFDREVFEAHTKINNLLRRTGLERQMGNYEPGGTHIRIVLSSPNFHYNYRTIMMEGGDCFFLQHSFRVTTSEKIGKMLDHLLPLLSTLSNYEYPKILCGGKNGEIGRRKKLCRMMVSTPYFNVDEEMRAYTGKSCFFFQHSYDASAEGIAAMKRTHDCLQRMITDVED